MNIGRDEYFQVKFCIQKGEGEGVGVWMAAYISLVDSPRGKDRQILLVPSDCLATQVQNIQNFGKADVY